MHQQVALFNNFFIKIAAFAIIITFDILFHNPNPTDNRN